MIQLNWLPASFVMLLRKQFHKSKELLFQKQAILTPNDDVSRTQTDDDSEIR